MVRAHRRWVVSLGGVILLGFALLAPEGERPLPPLPAPGAFVWDQDELWRSLQRDFEAVRERECAELDEAIDGGLDRSLTILKLVVGAGVGPDDAVLDELEEAIFQLGPPVAACPDRLADYADLVTRTRSAVKELSVSWDMGSAAVRSRLYRLLYGGRAALEEAMLQAPAGTIPGLLMGDDEPSQTPRAELLGVSIHSGDILVSRGGAPTSALIARGNDYPGNFSHVALACVEEGTGQLSLVEAHIERGLAVASAQEYLRDTKLRVMVLRLRADVPQLRADPLLPHRAALAARDEARRLHVPYDFAMDFADPSAKFCSEVASAAYRRHGVGLWMGMSTISSPGLARWLAAFGVRHFETQEPADLEYDPQLRVVAEWRDRETLFQDHVDNAVVDAMIEGAERGDSLGYRRVLLPVSRLAKAYSAALNFLGRIGPVPEGMSATAALRHQAFSARHRAAVTRVRELASEFRQQRGYAPPYWELVALARFALSEDPGSAVD